MSQDLVDLRKDLRERVEALRGIFDVPTLTARITELEEMSGFPDFWSDQARSTTLIGNSEWLFRLR